MNENSSAALTELTVIQIHSIIHTTSSTINKIFGLFKLCTVSTLLHINVHPLIATCILDIEVHGALILNVPENPQITRHSWTFFLPQSGISADLY